MKTESSQSSPVETPVRSAEEMLRAVSWTETNENGRSVLLTDAIRITELYASQFKPSVVGDKEEQRYTFQQMIDFAKWYSGMEESKVIAAYARYLREKGRMD